MGMLAGLAALPVSATAAVSIAGGGWIQGDPSRTGAAASLSSGASISAVPLEVQGSLLFPLASNGGYAAIAEIRGFTGGGYVGAYVGAVAGLGAHSRDRSSGAVITIFAGKSIAPRTSIEFRFYKQTEASGSTAGFAGIRFTF